MSKIHPLLCAATVVRAILDGRQTQDRRPIKPQPEFTSSLKGTDYFKWEQNQGYEASGMTPLIRINAPMSVGDIFWVREPGKSGGILQDQLRIDITYTADGTTVALPFPERLLKNEKLPRWATHMHGIPNGIFKEAARTFLRVTNVRVERIQAISEADAVAEGCSPVTKHVPGWSGRMSTVRQGFRDLWDSLYAARALGWDANPWVWVHEFERCERPEGWPNA